MDSNAVPFTFQAGGGQLSFGGGSQELPACTWEAPEPSQDEDDGNDRKRRRVQVDMDKLGVSVLKLGSDMTFDFRSAHAEAEKKLIDITAERDELQNNLDVSRETIARLETEANHLRAVGRAEHDLIKAEKQRLEAQLVDIRTDLAEAKKKNRKLETRVKEEKANVTAKTEESQQLEDTLKEVKTKLKNARNKNKAKEQEFDNLKDDVNRLREDYTNLRSENELKVEECRNLQDDLLAVAQLNDRFSELETKNKELGEKRDLLMAEKLELKEDYNKLEGETDKLKDKIEQLKTENEELKLEKQELERDNNALADTCYGSPKTPRTPRKKATPKKSQPSRSPSVVESGSSSITAAGSMNESLSWIKDEMDSV
ncbi:hypothetical protein CkaCkLH20_04515 [Colletotrichum karsti]|uniref:Uncharacterized protein n=1 Tax=Colletotrichum karsti TaxID=1095194 RepID=A0A9P6I804_9PEZI|nr:uncharacterized protein CkaCkLH20_04515 [Colletotrichum karsti]KAF9877939.1 hypothetical protein CkaCkLH20_04515 [Colletotrichum karsti]